MRNWKRNICFLATVQGMLLFLLYFYLLALILKTCVYPKTVWGLSIKKYKHTTPSAETDVDNAVGVDITVYGKYFHKERYYIRLACHTFWESWPPQPQQEERVTSYFPKFFNQINSIVFLKLNLKCINKKLAIFVLLLSLKNSNKELSSNKQHYHSCALPGYGWSDLSKRTTKPVWVQVL